MIKLAPFFLTFGQLTAVHAHPAGEVGCESAVIAVRAVTLSSIPVTTSYSRAIESLQSASATVKPSLTGTILTELPSGAFTRDPLNAPGATTISKPLYPNETPLNPGPTEAMDPVSVNIFQPIQTGRPPLAIPARNDHPVRKQHITDVDVPIETNKFYANFFLGSQGFPVWTHPYSLAWTKGSGGSYGMAISHTTRERFAFGPDPNKPQFFVSPLGIHHIVLSADELKADTSLTVEHTEAFSTYVNLRPNSLAGTRILMSFPVVQGMGMVTAMYDKAKPVIKTTVFFRSLNYMKLVNDVTHKYRIVLNDGSHWLLYATPIGSIGTPPFILENSTTITGPTNFLGRIQVTKNPSGEDAESTFDYSAGAYAISATVSGTANGPFGSYTLSWKKGGVGDRPLLMYALPHHVESFDQRTQAALKNITLVTTTKGFARAIVADQMTMVENDLPNTIGFAPWTKNPNGAAGGSEYINLNSQAVALINQAGISELSQAMIPQTSLNSMYFSGKGLAKFATIIYTMNSLTGNSQYAATGLDRLKDAFNVFVNNTQPEPLVYDTIWKGIVSGASYKPPYDLGLDFGNTAYNDHHFHYGYFVYTAAVIGHLDPDWLGQGSNKAWVNSLVQDFANPVTDEFFPFQRSFDWFHGHSWAKGLFESGDGKDQESTSEDTFATYATKMWGKIIRDPNMEARANLQLAVQARSLRNYFLLTQDNKNQPAQFLPNKATGILFENKIDHTTYFGGKIEYIEGIHMIPFNPSSAYTRSRQFVQEEWDTYFSNGRAEQAEGGWKSILKSNQALIDPQASYDFFANPNFNEPLDSGASRTWYLAYSAALLGAIKIGVQEGPQMNYAMPGQPLEPVQPIQSVQSGPVVSGPLPFSPQDAGTRTQSQSPVAQSTWPVGFTWPTKSGGVPVTTPTSTPTPTQTGSSTMDMSNDRRVASSIATPDMSWALQDKDNEVVGAQNLRTGGWNGQNVAANEFANVEEGKSDDEWEYELDCDDEDGEEDGSW
ncbi:endo-1,3(4)-beta-glucanase 1 precursor [Decorospora gaudefroyi]|uniref:glucan endo-1,3-beta-D-glucosidase n=1 Tax=Decorospora gaudefroyi TaxID=184978 RepID=A0A6A5K611_9PLEO|nr:endo-1,3(4)-beta-glucanase 1 precursor [Decorospora gaudefroyi]